MSIEWDWQDDSTVEISRALRKRITKLEAQLHDACFKRDGFKAELDMQDVRIAELEAVVARRGDLLQVAAGALQIVIDDLARGV